MSDAGTNASQARLDAVRAAVGVWTGQMVDMGGRNTLLYFKDLKAGTLDIGTGVDAPIIADLLAGKTVRLSAMFTAPDDLKAAAKRARTIRSKAQVNFEERGLDTLYLAYGTATWRNERGAGTPAAPVLLREAAFKPRGGAAEDFDIALQDEWEINPTLLHYLQTEFQVGVDADALLELLESESAAVLQPGLVFEDLMKRASGVHGFAVLPRIVFGNFSYAKLPMVKDLQAALENDLLAGHDLIAAIAGDESARETIKKRLPEPVPALPDTISPENEFLVLDADSSQSSAIAAVTAGGDLVIEGPPGTGKSQTIANLIATLAADGKRVLFVAEKRAAIDAVLDRLNRRGLGNLVLDLHDGGGSRKRLAQDLSRALHDAARLPLPDVADLQRTLVKRRETLRERTRALHEARPPWGKSVYALQARVLETPKEARSEVRVRADLLRTLSGEVIAQASDDLRALADLGGLDVQASDSPWIPAYLAGTITSAADAERALDEVSLLNAATLPAAVASVQRLSAASGLTAGDTLSGWSSLVSLVGSVAAMLERFTPQIYAEPLDEHAKELALAARGIFARMRASMFDSGYRAAKKRLRALSTGTKPKGAELYEAARAAAEQRRAWLARGAATTLHVPAEFAAARDAVAAATVALAAVEKRAGGVPLADVPEPELTARLRAFLADQATLTKLPELYRLRTALVARGLEAVVADAAARTTDARVAVQILDHVWQASILEMLSVSDPLIGAFEAAAHSRAVDDYCDADRKHIESGAVRVLRAVAERSTKVRDQFPHESDVIEHQARLKRRHLPVRALFQAAPNVLTALKPCWAMSPLVVAQLLPAERSFDVVVFDEASQITPSDAISSLLRADRAVVAGDTKQLPPTAFFIAGEDDDAEAPPAPDAALTKGLESILHVMGAMLPSPRGTRTLAWHYRSRDERLIAFSNAQPSLYDHSLTTFPGVAGASCLTHDLVSSKPGIAQEESASEEVARVVQLMIDHARTRPGESLGVIAMGIKHAERIAEALRTARAKAPELDAYFDNGPDAAGGREPVFVKNLERVQGDERDAIILSVGYGKGPGGKMSYRFGPINMDGGERRLNVAITRARRRMTVVSSFTAADMDPAKLRAEGAQMLGRYLAYVQSRGEDLGGPSAPKPTLDGLLTDVSSGLQSQGVPVEPLHGASDVRIDVAARRSGDEDDDRMVAAFETDGSAYAAIATVRDRDRLRREHLERLGWRFHRIWSTGWMRDPAGTAAQAAEAWRVAVASTGDDDMEKTLPPPAPAAMQTPAETAERGPKPRVAAGRPIDSYTHQQIVQVIQWIESDSLLRTEEELLAETMSVLGFKRRGPKIVQVIQDAIRAARS